jgi:hypothetical protein
MALVLALLPALGACGEGRDELAAARCKDALRQTLGTQAKLAFPGPSKAALSDDAVYGWHLDLDVEAKLGSGEIVACSSSRTGKRHCFSRSWSGDVRRADRDRQPSAKASA